MSGGYSGKFSRRQCKIQLSWDNLIEQKVLESAFFRLSESLKSKLSSNMVLPPGHNGFISVLSYSKAGTYVIQINIWRLRCVSNSKFGGNMYPLTDIKYEIHWCYCFKVILENHLVVVSCSIRNVL